MDVWDDTSASDGGLDEGVELFITSNSELEMSWSDSLHLKILGSVTSELKDLSGQILEDSGTVNCGSGSHSAVSADSTLQDSVNSTNWELKEFKIYVRRMIEHEGGLIHRVGLRLRSIIALTVTCRIAHHSLS